MTFAPPCMYSEERSFLYISSSTIIRSVFVCPSFCLFSILFYTLLRTVLATLLQIEQLIICEIDGDDLLRPTDRVTFTSLALKSSLRRSVPVNSELLELKKKYKHSQKEVLGFKNRDL